MHQLIELKSQFFSMFEHFKDHTLKAVHYAIKMNVPALNLHNLYGDGGEKFKVGGLF